MIRNIKNTKGITLISMILTVIVLLIIVGTISYSSRNSLQKKKLDNFFNDIDALNDAVSVYYIKNGVLPVYYSNYDVNGNQVEYKEINIDNTYLNIPKFDYDDVTSYYILDISKLENISLNNYNNVPKNIDSENIDSGNFFSNKAQDEKALRDSIGKGIFVINSSSHMVYYTNPIKVAGNTYYTKNTNYNKIPTFSKNDKTTIEDDIINAGKNQNQLEENNIRIVFWANGGANTPDDIIVSKQNNGKPDDLLNYILNKSQFEKPTKTGDNFLGWSKEDDSNEALYKYIEQTNSYSIKTGENDINFSNTAESVINLYAVWEQDKNQILKCYYPAGTGGIIPTTNGKSVKREGSTEAVSNYICIDIPSSGYEITWAWTSDPNYTDISQEARYVGKSMTTSIEKKKTAYETTEPGTIQLRGSFADLQVKINGNSVNIELDEKGKEVHFYKISKSKLKSEVGDKAATWWTGNDGKFTIPSNPNTYYNIGIVDPLNLSVKNDNYANFNQLSSFYLKSVILTDSTNTTNVAYNNKQKSLGNIETIPDDGKQYCLYPRFGARNYMLVEESGTTAYYHESLKEAYDQSCNLQESGKNYNQIVLMRNIYSFKNSKIDERLYVANYDPTYADTVQFSSKSVTLDFKNYTMKRQGSLQISSNVEVKALSTNNVVQEHGLIFEGTNTSLIELSDKSKLYLSGGVTLKNQNGSVINLNNSSKFYGIYGIVENTSPKNPNAIISESATTNICLGISKNENKELNDGKQVSESNIIIKTNQGETIKTDGNIYWKAGILNTKDPANKQGYNDNAKIKSRAGVAPCLSYVESEGRINIKLRKREWEWKDDDSGASKEYFAANLQDANNSLNLKNSSNPYTIKWLYPVEDSKSYNDTTITKGMIIDFNCPQLNKKIFKTSKLTISSKNVEVKNLCCETERGIEVSKDGGLTINNCLIGTNTYGIDAIINNGYIKYNASSSGKSSGFYTKSSGTDAKRGVAIKNMGTMEYNLGNSSEDKIYTEGSCYAIYNYGNSASFKYEGASSTSNNIYSSSTSTAKYVVYNGNNSYMKYSPGPNGKMEAKNDSTTKAYCVLENDGEFEMDSGIVKSISKATSSNYTVYNRNLFKLYGSAQIQSNYYGIYNFESKSKSYIYGNAKINAEYSGINTNKGKVYVSHSIDESLNPINNSSNVLGPEISGKSYGIYAISGANVVLGANEVIPSVSTSSPNIKSDNIGIYITGKETKLNFYDGVIYGGKNTISNNGGKLEIPTGYKRSLTSDKKTCILKK